MTGSATSGQEQPPIDATVPHSANPAGEPRVPYRLRRPEQIAGFFDGLDLVDPGVVPLNHWGVEVADRPTPLPNLAGVARKP